MPSCPDIFLAIVRHALLALVTLCTGESQTKSFPFIPKVQYTSRNNAKVEEPMYTITFSRVAQGNYTISDNNDSRLLCIGYIIVDQNLRKDVKKALYYAAEIGMERPKQFETPLYSLHLSQADPETILIKLTQKTDAKIHYQTDMPLEEFITLIEDYEDAVESGPHTITIVRIQDSFEFTTNE